MNEEPVAALERALLQVLVRAMDRISRLEGDDPPPALLGEERARLAGVEPVRAELDLARPIERRDLAAQVKIALLVHRLDAGMSVLGRTVDLARLALLVRPVLLGEVQDRERLPAFFDERDVVAGRVARFLVRADGERHGD